ncbi:ACP S-malonyltransferase [Streptomyces sp. MB09-02B]|uniref:ACP S-malonyltransferase n=1 Tax=Streptomyces sp. MB09-02B TaxID=3028667 RepID=UPI0029ADFDB6|nr:ACP S-malonyltransferase [Streptomyces sp. MB09-02B]MDX3642280.1 ACP S-malonyltransferase [Streptomyces sp. MB09-02B]
MNRTAFVFPGQGSQHVGMGRHLLAQRPDLVQTYYRTAEDVLGVPLSRLSRHGPGRDLDDPAISQPAVLLTSLLTLDVLRGRGVEPDAVAGHGLGEYAALIAAGVVEWTDALRLVRLRGELVATVDDQVRGATAAVLGLDRRAVERLCAQAAADTGRTIEIAGDNGPGQTVVSGEAEAVTRLTRAAHAAGAVRVARLKAGGPFHSSLLRGIEAEFTEALITTEFRDPRIPLISSVTGARVSTAAEAIAALRSQLTSPVRWSEAVKVLAATGVDRFVEAGPGLVLGGLIRRIAPHARVHATNSARQLDLTVGALAAADSAV